jgi:hypothetical protein
MDNMKLIGRSEEELNNLIQILKTINNDIKIKFRLEKCAKICLKSGKINRKQYMETQYRLKLNNQIQRRHTDMWV